jgi:hypothetical protein
MNPVDEIRRLLQQFQDGYAQRDASQLEPFMALFTDDAEVIGTNGIEPGVEEWYLGRDAARDLVAGDWDSWGDVRLNLSGASIRVRGEVGWIAAAATVTQTIGPENYASFLAFVKDFIDDADLPAEQKLHYILRGGANTVYELRRGERFVWPLRLTAVVIRQAGGWKFGQLHFSFPTIYFPDVRVIADDEGT